MSRLLSFYSFSFFYSSPCVMWLPRQRKVEIKDYYQERELRRKERREKKKEKRKKGGDISNLLHTAFYSSPLVPVEGSRTSQPCLILHFVRGSGHALVFVLM